MKKFTNCLFFLRKIHFGCSIRQKKRQKNVRRNNVRCTIYVRRKKKRILTGALFLEWTIVRRVHRTSVLRTSFVHRTFVLRTSTSAFSRCARHRRQPFRGSRGTPSWWICHPADPSEQRTRLGRQRSSRGLLHELRQLRR